MGRAQKFKKIRKLQKVEDAQKAQEKTKLYLTTAITIIVIAVGGYFLNNWYKEKTMNNQTTYEALMHTNQGDIRLSLDGEAAPKTVENFVTLAKKGYYDGTLFHRVIKDFMIQGGDPLSKDDDPANDGTGGESAWGGQFEDEINVTSLGLDSTTIKSLEDSGYTYNDKLKSKNVTAGVIAMANSGPNTNGSQFFIVTKEAQPHLDGRHTVFGKVVEGMEVVNKIAAVEVDEGDRPKQNVVVNDIEIIEKKGSDNILSEDDLSLQAEMDNSSPIGISDIQINSEGDGKVNIEQIE